MDIDKNTVLVSGAIVFRNHQGKHKWFLVKQSRDGEWEIPKVIVRKGESSVRAAIRMTGEKGSMTTKVLEEAGRAGGITTINQRILPQRYIYYLMILKFSLNEPIGFSQHLWIDYAGAQRKLNSKREKVMLKQAREVFRKWKKERLKLKKLQKYIR